MEADGLILLQMCCTKLCLSSSPSPGLFPSLLPSLPQVAALCALLQAETGYLAYFLLFLALSAGSQSQAGAEDKAFTPHPAVGCSFAPAAARPWVERTAAWGGYSLAKTLPDSPGRSRLRAQQWLQRGEPWQSCWWEWRRLSQGSLQLAACPGVGLGPRLGCSHGRSTLGSGGAVGAELCSAPCTQPAPSPRAPHVAGAKP